MIEGKSIELLRNLSQYEYAKEYYDFHNDYDFQKLYLENDIMRLIFIHITNRYLISLNFKGVEITKALFFNVSNIEYLTVDSLYRGRVEVNGQLLEFSSNDKTYYYLEFYEGQKLEFWAESISVEKM